MKEFTYVIKDEIGIHARPAGKIASTAKKFEADINIHFKGKEVKITKIMALMKLNVKQNDTIKITFDGSDEEDAYQALSKLIEENL